MNTDYIFIRKPSATDGPADRRQAKVVPPAIGLVGAVLLLAVLGAAVWCLGGTITNSIHISGIVFPQYGIKQVTSHVDGIVSYVQPEVGDMVGSGQMIAIIPQTDVLAEIQALQTAGGSEPAEEGQEDSTLPDPAGEALDALYARYQNESLIYTPVRGRVVEIARAGQLVHTGDIIASVTNSEMSSNMAEIRAYVSMTVAQSIKKGMEVRVYPQFSADEGYGYIQGLVSGISSYPITETDISEALGRFYPSENIPKEENIIEVRVTLMAGSDKSTLSWSGTEGDRLAIDIGTLCSMEVIVSEMTPWESLWSK